MAFKRTSYTVHVQQFSDDMFVAGAKPVKARSPTAVFLLTAEEKHGLVSWLTCCCKGTAVWRRLGLSWFHGGSFDCTTSKPGWFASALSDSDSQQSAGGPAWGFLSLGDTQAVQRTGRWYFCWKNLALYYLIPMNWILISIFYTIGPTGLDENCQFEYETIQCSDVFRGIMIADPPLRKTLWCNWPGSASTAARNDVPRLRVDFWRSVWRDPKGSQTEICHPFPAQTIAQGNGCARLGICDESSSYLPHSCSGAWFISQELVAPNEDKKIQELNHQLWSLNQYIPMMFPSYSHYIRFFHHYSPMDLMGRVAILCTVQICAVGVGCWLEHLCVWQ